MVLYVQVRKSSIRKFKACLAWEYLTRWSLNNLLDVPVCICKSKLFWHSKLLTEKFTFSCQSLIWYLNFVSSVVAVKKQWLTSAEWCKFNPSYSLSSFSVWAKFCIVSVHKEILLESFSFRPTVGSQTVISMLALKTDAGLWQANLGWNCACFKTADQVYLKNTQEADGSEVIYEIRHVNQAWTTVLTFETFSDKYFLGLWKHNKVT